LREAHLDCTAVVAHYQLLASNRRSALEAFGSGLEWDIGWVLGVAFGSSYGVRLVVLRSVGGIAWVGFGIEV
jgi:hypothetical protein